MSRRAVTVPLAVQELDDLARIHDDHAKTALADDGDGEMHDWHEGRAFELRRIAICARAGLPLPPNGGWVRP